jgi:plastocyanin
MPAPRDHEGTEVIMRTIVRLAVASGLVGLVACGGGENGGGVGPGSIAKVQVDAEVSSLFPLQTSQLSAIAVDQSGRPVGGAGAATWKTSNAAVASVSASGLVTATAVGTAVISATIDGTTGTLTISVVQAANTAIIAMPGFSFSPFHATIKVTGKVIFDFPSVSHNVIFVAKSGVPADIQETSRQSVTRTFNAAGLFQYDCRLHPGMSGEIEVVP